MFARNLFIAITHFAPNSLINRLSTQREKARVSRARRCMCMCEEEGIAKEVRCREFPLFEKFRATKFGRNIPSSAIKISLNSARWLPPQSGNGLKGTDDKEDDWWGDDARTHIHECTNTHVHADVSARTLNSRERHKKRRESYVIGTVQKYVEG